MHVNVTLTLPQIVESIKSYNDRVDKEGQKLVKDIASELVVLLAREAQRLDLVGATKQYLRGFTSTHTVAAHSYTSVVYNTAPHQYWAELGRKAKRAMPPHEPIMRWAISRGIPLEAVYPIRKKIAEEGTIERFGGGGKGGETTKRVYQSSFEDVLYGRLDDFWEVLMR